MRFKLLILITILPCSFLSAQSQRGSLNFEDIAPVLKQNPTVSSFIDKHLDVSNVGDAPRIGYGDNPNLAGVRVSPYSFPAKPKGQKGEFTLELIIESKIIYLDAQKKPTDLKNAVDFKETFLSIKLYELKKDS
jgi:hypothetical protein